MLVQSGFKNALTVSIDGSGDRISTSKVTSNSKIKKSRNFYTTFTNFLGFKSVEGEYKLMGMAAYGKVRYDLSNIIYFNKKSGKIITNKDYKNLFDIQNYTSINEPSYAEKFISKKFNITRPKSSKDFKQQHYDLAASVQFQFRQTI